MKIPLFWQIIFNLKTEYYENDEEKYVINHSSKERDVNKIQGFYYGNTIYLKNGEKKIISYQYITITPEKYLFIIYSLLNGKPTIISIKIIENNENISGPWIDDDNDRRKNMKGLSCFSFDISKLKHIFKVDLINRKNWCLKLLPMICDLQLLSNTKIMLTPFELLSPY
jgi:hypothetical protein